MYLRFLILLVALAMLTLPASAEVVSGAKAYVLDTCPVSGQKLGAMGDPIVKEINGREVRFCCGGCPDAYQAKLAGYEKKVDAAIIAKQKDSYPLDTCVVGGGKLGAMGDPVDHVYGNRLVRFCCANCVDAFKAEPAKYVAKIDAAVVEKQGETYPKTTCIMSGKSIEGKSVDVVVGNQLVKVCGSGCATQVTKEPVKYLSMVYGGEKAEAAPAPASGSGAK